MTDELKECPFCGAKADLHKPSLGFYVACRTAECRGNAEHHWFTKKLAVKAWDTRTKPEGVDIAPLDPDMPAQELRLHMGELSDNEIRVARAAIQWANSRHLTAKE